MLEPDAYIFLMSASIHRIELKLQFLRSFCPLIFYKGFLKKMMVVSLLFASLFANNFLSTPENEEHIQFTESGRESSLRYTHTHTSLMRNKCLQIVDLV